MTIKRTVVDGRTYMVVTDEARINEPLSVYCQVYRVRKDGKPGRRITTGSIIHAVLLASRASEKKENAAG